MSAKTWHKIRWATRKNREPCWLLAYKLPDDSNTKQKVVPREVAPTQRYRREAEQWATDEMGRITAPAKPPPAAESPMVDIYERWIAETVAARLRDEAIQPATAAEYKSHWKHWIRPFLDGKPASAIDVPLGRAFVRHVREKLAPTSVHNRYYTFCQLLDDAIADGWVPLTVNPMKSEAVTRELPELVRRIPRILDIETFQVLVLCPLVPAARRIRYLTAALGLFRDGELQGLRVGDVDRARWTYTLKEALKMRGPEGYATRGRTKTRDSARTNPFHPTVALAMVWWLDEGWEKHTARKPRPEDPLFPNHHGESTRPASAEEFREDLRAAGIDPPEGITFQDLRAMGATWLERAGASDACRARLMGHAPKTTAGKHYTGELIDADREALSKVLVTDIVPSLVVPSTSSSHLRGLNSGPTVYEALRHASPHVTSGNHVGTAAQYAARTADSLPVVTPDCDDVVPSELANLSQGLAELSGRWDDAERFLGGAS